MTRAPLTVSPSSFYLRVPIAERNVGQMITANCGAELTAKSVRRPIPLRLARLRGVGNEGPAFSVRPASRNEWEQTVRWLKLGKSTKYLALCMSTFADPDGSRIFPGGEVLALTAEAGRATVTRAVVALRDELGLLVRVKRGNRHQGHADEYRLTLPVDLSSLAHLRIVPPAGRRV